MTTPGEGVDGMPVACGSVVPQPTMPNDGDATHDQARLKVQDSDIQTARDVGYRVAQNRGLTAYDADDIAQIVAEKLLSVHEVPDNVAAWAQRVALNAITDAARRRKVSNGDGVWVDREVQIGEGSGDTLADVTYFIRSQRQVSAQGMRRQAGREMETLLRSRLNDREMQVLLLIATGQSQQQIADALGYASADTVKTTLRRIREKLQDVAPALRDFRAHPHVY